MEKTRLNNHRASQAELNPTESEAEPSSFGKMKLLIRQLWYVPFFWSLTYYLYWIVRDFVTLKATVLQIPRLTWVGAVVSIGLILVGVQTRARSKSEKGAQGDQQDIQLGLSNRFGIDSENSVPEEKENNYAEELENSETQPLMLGLDLGVCSQGFGCASQVHSFEEILPECLACKELAKCKMAMRAVRKTATGTGKREK